MIVKVKKVLSLDPGVNIGFALWDADKFKRGVLMHPLEYGHLYNKEQEKTFYDFKLLVSRSNIITAYIENAVLMKNSEKGRVTADSGALVKLSQTIGRITQILIDQGVKVILVTVASWKGTLPKYVCERRIRRTLPRINKNQTNHAIDAIGIGLYKLGKF